MSRGLGYLVFIAGLVGLGIWGRADHAADIQERIGAAAKGLPETSVHGIGVSVSGRDIELSGIADSADEGKALVAAAEAIEGRREVRSSLTILERADPYRFEAVLAEDGGLTVTGNVPTEKAGAALASATGVEAMGGLTLASGAPAAWADAVKAALAELRKLKSGELAIEGTSIRLTGEAPDAATRKAVTAAAFPTGYSSSVDVAYTPPVADPYVLNAVLTENGALTVTGNIPSEEQRDALAAETGITALSVLEPASGAPEGWVETVKASLAQLIRLKSGALTIENTALSLSGDAPDAATRESVIAAVQGLPGITVAADVIYTPPLANPFLFRALRAADGSVSVEGNTPSDAFRADVATATGADAGILVLASGAPPGWEEAVRSGLMELGRLVSGELAAEGATLTLTGVAPDAETQASVATAMAALGGGLEVTSNIAFTPPAPQDIRAQLAIRYDRVRGLFVSGRAPDGISPSGVAAALGVSAVRGDFKGGATDAPDVTNAALGALAGFLPEFEVVALSVEGESTILRGKTLAEADFDQISARLAETGQFDTIDIARSAAQYQDGDTRPNPLSGATETYRGGFWIPDIQISGPTAASCDNATGAVLQTGRIRFLTGSAELDATSRSTVSTLAGIIASCFAGNGALRVEVGGHTDDVGSEDSNLTLSAARAKAVLDELIGRGIPADRIVSGGYGETQPIADNATEEGRAANRRTTIVWTE